MTWILLILDLLAVLGVQGRDRDQALQEAPLADHVLLAQHNLDQDQIEAADINNIIVIFTTVLFKNKFRLPIETQ